MKTIEEFAKEIELNKVLKTELLGLKPEEIVDFAAKHDCKTTLEEVSQFFFSKIEKGEILDEELAQVSGGNKDPRDSTWGECKKCNKLHRISYGDVTGVGTTYYCPLCGLPFDTVKYVPK